jgi:hypothetical protein
MKIRIYYMFAIFLLLIVHLNAQITEIADKSKGPGIYKIIGEKKDPIVILFKMHNSKPLMDLKINGSNATLMIDNGILWDQVWLFGSPLVDELELKPIEEGTIGGAGEGDPTASYTSTPIVLTFEDIIFYRQPVIVSPPSAGFAKMFPGADGQLCNTFFKHFIVEFDFIKNEVLLHNPEQFEYKGNGSVLDMQLTESGSHSVPFSFTMLDGKTYTDQVDIDFGGVYPFKIALGNKNQIQLPEDVEGIIGYGAQGKITSYRGKIISMKIGNYTFENPTIVFGDPESSRIHPDNLGVIGLPLFMKFKIIFDYINNKIYLDPNENYNIPLETTIR